MQIIANIFITLRSFVENPHLFIYLFICVFIYLFIFWFMYLFCLSKLKLTFELRNHNNAGLKSAGLSRSAMRTNPGVRALVIPICALARMHGG